MFAAIARFELQSRLRRASTWVYFGVLFALAFLFMNAAGGAFPGATVTFGTRGKALVNGPLALDAFTTLLGQLGLIVGGAIVGRAVYQDFEHDSHALFFTKPISKAAYLGGRFAGALVVVLGIYLSIGLGLWLGSRMPWLDQTRLGPTRFAAYAMPYLTSVIPNLPFSGAIFFAVASLARRILPIYVVSIVFVVGYLASQQLLADVDN